MAVVREYTVAGERRGAGARVVVMDDCYSGISAEELARRRMEVARIIRKIDAEAQRSAGQEAQR